MKSGPFTIPINPKLSEGESNTVGSVRAFLPTVQTVKEKVRGGTLGRSGGVWENIKRTGTQASVDSGIPLMTSGSKDLQSLQSDLSYVKRLMFTDAGKALTGPEKAIVEKAFTLTGKADDQIIEDIDRATRIMEEKEKLILGGANASRQTLPKAQRPLSSMSEEELMKIAGY